MNIEDIGVVLQHMNLKFESKMPSEDPADAKLRRFKDRWLFVATLIALAMVFGVCIGFLTLKPDSAYTGIALNGVIGLAMALAGYYVRGKTS